MKYEEPQKLTKSEAEHVFSGGVAADICEGLVALALGDDDWRWVQRLS